MNWAIRLYAFNCVASGLFFLASVAESLWLHQWLVEGAWFASCCGWLVAWILMARMIQRMPTQACAGE